MSGAGVRALNGINNLVHKTGNETIAGNKMYTGIVNNTLLGTLIATVPSTNNARAKWYKVATFDTSMVRRTIEIDIYGSYNNSAHSIGKFLLYIQQDASKVNVQTVYNRSNVNTRAITICTTTDINGELALWVEEAQYMAFLVYETKEMYGTGQYPFSAMIKPQQVTPIDSKPVVGDTYVSVTDPEILSDVQ